MIQRTLVLLKPDAVSRGIMGEIITRFERVGLKIVGMKLVMVDRDFSKLHYAEHVDKGFYPGLENLLVMGPVLAMVLEGVEVISQVRKMVGATEPKSALPGTIRGDYTHMSYGFADERQIALKNIIHASDSVENSKKEIDLWFNNDELHSYTVTHEVHTMN